MPCPHEKIQHCPLYVAAHDPHYGISCEDGLAYEGGCAVSRGLNYPEAVGRLSASGGNQLIAILKFNEANELRKAQVARNMRAAGFH